MTVHVPVMLAEIVEWLAPRAGQTIVDGTAGGGGHTLALAELVGSQGRIIALDLDPGAVAALLARGLPPQVEVVHASYVELPEVLTKRGHTAVDGLVLDLGLSSDQLADPTRGFSFQGGGELDMRFNPDEGPTAWHLVNRTPERELADLIYAYGEERHSRRIARRIVEARRGAPIETAEQLAALVRGAVRVPRRERIDPATRTFQALRIAVNDELNILDRALTRLPDCLRPGGRMAVISFHSLEDRRVKEAFRNDPRLINLTKKPLRAGDDEVVANPRASSAKLRTAARREGEPR